MIAGDITLVDDFMFWRSVNCCN